jgi:drug/metabolite transporter (DMT)-like permease
MAARRRISDDTIVYLTAVSTVVIAGSVLAIILWRFPGFASWPDFPFKQLVSFCVLFAGIGFFYFLVSKLRYKSLGLLPSFVYEPLARLHVFIVVPISIIFLEDHATTRELIAIGLALSAILLIGVVNRSDGSSSGGVIGKGLILIFIAGIFAAGLQLLAKVLMTPDIGIQIPVLVYILGSNTVTTLIGGLSHLPNRPRKANRMALAYGFGAGVCNTVALGSLLFFLIDGKASRIYSIGALSMLIPVAINLMGNYERKPRRAEIFALFCALAAVVLQTTGGDS